MIPPERTGCLVYAGKFSQSIQSLMYSANNRVGADRKFRARLSDSHFLDFLRHFILLRQAQSTACDRGISISSKGNDDLAELAAVLEIPVHFHHLVELECAIDDRLERAARKALSRLMAC